MSNVPSFTITIGIEPDSLAALTAAGAALYAIPGFCSSNRTARPLVVEAISRLAPTLSVRWDENWEGFASYGDLSAEDAASAGRAVSAGSAEPVAVGEVLSVGASLRLASRVDGAPSAVTFRTLEAGSFTCGVGFGPGSRPGCAATLTAALDVMLAPCRSMLLMFATSPFEAGAWVERTVSPALLVDMTTAVTRTVTVDRHAPDGWREADQAWARAVPAGTPITDLLRTPPPANVPL